LGRLARLENKIKTTNLSVGSPVAVERIRGGRLTKIRERIAIRDEYTCQVCKRVIADGEVDHKVPLHLGGQESDENRSGLLFITSSTAEDHDSIMSLVAP